MLFGWLYGVKRPLNSAQSINSSTDIILTYVIICKVVLYLTLLRPVLIRGASTVNESFVSSLSSRVPLSLFNLMHATQLFICLLQTDPCCCCFWKMFNTYCIVFIFVYVSSSHHWVLTANIKMSLATDGLTTCMVKAYISQVKS